MRCCGKWSQYTRQYTYFAKHTGSACMLVFNFKDGLCTCTCLQVWALNTWPEITFKASDAKSYCEQVATWYAFTHLKINGQEWTDMSRGLVSSMLLTKPLCCEHVHFFLQPEFNAQKWSILFFAIFIILSKFFITLLIIAVMLEHMAQGRHSQTSVQVHVFYYVLSTWRSRIVCQMFMAQQCSQTFNSTGSALT